MPKEITHWILAEKAYQRLDQDSLLKQIIRRHKNLYMIGAVVCDTPFYLLYGRDRKTMNQMGKKIHDSPDNSYEPLAKATRLYDTSVPLDLLSLICGMISHIHADAVFHPLVYYFTHNNLNDLKNRKKAISLHHRFESFIDIYYVRNMTSEIKNTDTNISSFPAYFSEFLKNIEIEEDRLLNLLHALFKNINRVTIKKTLRSHAIIQRCFYDTRLKSFFELLNRIPGVSIEEYITSFYPYSIKHNGFLLLKLPEPDKNLTSETPDSAQFGLTNPNQNSGICQSWESIFDLLNFKNLTYRHPVTGEKFCHSVKDLEKKAIDNILHIFGMIEYALNSDSQLIAQIFSQIKGPNLLTGIAGFRKSDMRYFL